MGVPALFRWLSVKYPKIVERVIEIEQDEGNDDSPIPINLTDPNPNGMEFDNLYLDMNGIIHPCCHPIDKPAPPTEEAMMVEIFKYLDRIFSMIRPRKLLFMAIDGVAPRAKMNQQRSRRFRAARERREKTEKAIQLREQFPEDNDEEDTEPENGSFDTNCITPGTQFMALVAESIRYYIMQKMTNEAAWKKVKVIFSDANVPGEGEHKIVDYIRRQRLDPDYDPNTKHVIYGLDADLIMLSMATHEPYFKVLREDVFWEEQVKYTPCQFCNVKGHSADNCPERAKSDPDFKLAENAGKPFIFLNVSILREYLEAELKPSIQLPFKWDLERAIDDWIFLCFFVGNDFLPHLPSLEIREGAIDLLIDIYKSNLIKMGGFICHNGSVDLRRTQFILNDLGKVEDRIFQKRREKDLRRNENIKRRKVADAEKEELLAAQQALISLEHGNNKEKNKAAAQSLKSQMNADAGTDEPEDNVKLWETGFKDRYYQHKFKVIYNDSPEVVKDICHAYVEGLCWVMAYYYQGCPSWKWFYPYNYSPFASDMVDVSNLDLRFELGEPFRPFDQLMGVFPADSRNLVPAPFRNLMTDPTSEIIDFYPEDFEIDLNGKKQAWQGVVILPFITEKRLLDALEKFYPEVDPLDLKLNILGQDRLFISSEFQITSKLLSLLDDERHSTPLNPQETDGLAGYVKIDPQFPALGEPYPSPLPDQGCPDISSHTVNCFIYFVPYHERVQLKHKAILLPGAIRPPNVLTPEDIANVTSGVRVPGRLAVDAPGGRPVAYGSHSMHHEYSQDYQARDSGYHHRRDYERRKRDYPNDQSNDIGGIRSEQHYPPPLTPYPPPPPFLHGQVPYGGGGNPYEILRGNQEPPLHMQQALYNVFQRGPPPPPPPQRHERSRLDDLYGRYPPPAPK